MMKRKRRLVARYIHKTEYPKLIQEMSDDGLICLITPKGLRWYSGRYVVNAKEVYSVWGLTKAQYARLRDYIIAKNPWGSVDEFITG